MGRAIYGAVGGPDPRHVAELSALRSRVRELEAEVARLREGADAGVGVHALDLELLSTSDTALV